MTWKFIQNIFKKHFQKTKELWFKRSTQKQTLSNALILVMTSQILKFMGWVKIQKNDFIKNETWPFYEIEKKS